MSCECMKIKRYKIPKFFVDVESLSNKEHKIFLNMTLNTMIPKDTENEECIVEIQINYKTENQESILSVTIRGYVDVDIKLTEQERSVILKNEATPLVYEELRKFIGETIARANLDIPNIPPYSIG